MKRPTWYKQVQFITRCAEGILRSVRVKRGPAKASNSPFEHTGLRRPIAQEEATDEVHAFDATDRPRHARGSQAAAADRAEQRTLPADAGRGAQVCGLRRRGRLRCLRDDRAPLPFGGLRDLGGAASPLCRPRRPDQAHQILAAGAGAAGVGSDPRCRGTRRTRPPDQGAGLCRVRPRLPGPLGQRARTAIPRHRRADGRLGDRQPQPTRLRGDPQGHQEGLDRGRLGVRRPILQGPVSL